MLVKALFMQYNVGREDVMYEDNRECKVYAGWHHGIW